MIVLLILVCHFFTACLPSAAAAGNPQEKELKRLAYANHRTAFRAKMVDHLVTYDLEAGAIKTVLPIIQEHTLSIMELALKPEYADALRWALQTSGNVHMIVAGQTPLYAAVNANNAKGAQLLLDAQSHVNHQGPNGYTPLICSIGISNLSIIQMLLTKNASHSLTNNEGRTALHMAALYEYIEGARTLLESGAPVNAQDKEGNTPLHLIARASCITDEDDGDPAFHPFIILLIAFGADPDLKNLSGKSSTELVDANYEAAWQNSLAIGESQRQTREQRIKARFYRIDHVIPHMPEKCIAHINDYLGEPT